MLIQACSFALSSEVFKNCDDIVSRIGDGGTLTWGGANRTLVSRLALKEEMGKIEGNIPLDNWDLRQQWVTAMQRINHIQDEVYVDMEN